MTISQTSSNTLDETKAFPLLLLLSHLGAEKQLVDYSTLRQAARRLATRGNGNGEELEALARRSVFMPVLGSLLDKGYAQQSIDGYQLTTLGIRAVNAYRSQAPHVTETISTALE